MYWLHVTEMCAAQFLKFSVPSCLRALRVDRPEARDRLPAPRAEAARVHRVPGVCGDIRMNLINEVDVKMKGKCV